MDIKDLKRTSLEFRQLAGNLLNSGIDDVDANLYRFKEYIDKSEIISKIIKNKIKETEVDFRSYFPIKSDKGWCQVSIPKEEDKHIKAIYDLIEYITKNEVAIQSIAFRYIWPNNKIKDIIQNYLDKTISPLIDYIIIEISKEMIAMGEINMNGINITGVNGSSINIANNNSTQNITNNEKNNTEIKELIESIRKELSAYNLTEEEVESVQDDLDVIEEQVDNSIDRPTRLKKACKNLSSFLDGATGVAIKATNFGLSIKCLIDMISNLHS